MSWSNKFIGSKQCKKRDKDTLAARGHRILKINLQEVFKEAYETSEAQKAAYSQPQRGHE